MTVPVTVLVTVLVTALTSTTRESVTRPEEATGAAANADPFAFALAGHRCRLDRAGATPAPLDVRRWQASAVRPDRWLLDACRGPTVDLGCGPARLVAALAERGVPVLGVDTSPVAVRRGAERGVAVLRRDIFDPLPGEGRWHHALLADGNLGIGGDPVRLLRRVRRLLHPRGSVLVELADQRGLWRGPARLLARNGPIGDWFPWALVGRDVIGEVAASAGLRLHRLRRVRTARVPRGRVFAELAR